jgi:hypothetical protein
MEKIKQDMLAKEGIHKRGPPDPPRNNGDKSKDVNEDEEDDNHPKKILKTDKSACGRKSVA